MRRACATSRRSARRSTSSGRRRGARSAGDRTRLAERELAWSRIEPIKATLEDVFVQLVGEGGGEARPMNLRRIRAIAKKEIIQILRDPRSLMVALLMPLMQMVLLGYGVNLDIKHVPICVFDREGSQQSEALLKAFQASQYFWIVEAERDYARRRPRDRRAAAAGSRSSCRTTSPDARRRRIGSVQAILDATDDNTANIALGYAAGGGRRVFQRRPTAADRRRKGQPPPAVPAVACSTRVWFNEDLDSRNFIIPGVVALVMALVGAQLTSLTISREWERGTMELLVSTPVTPMELMLGKLLPYFVIGLLDAAFCLAIAVFWFEVPFRGTLSTLFFTTSLFLVGRARHRLSHLGQHPQPGRREPDRAAGRPCCRRRCCRASPFRSTRCRRRSRRSPISFLRAITSRSSKSVFLKGAGVGDLVAPIGLLALYAAVVGLLAARAFRKTLD